MIATLDPRHVYIGLAIVLGAWVSITHVTGPWSGWRQRHESASYDWMLTHRFRVPKPDPDIVLLDIDERSLATMANEYGQWPWPRDVLATTMFELERQGARAIVFDILFSDPDRQNPVSEQAFEQAVARNGIAYFPVLRLPAANDAKSALHAGDLAGLVVPRPPSTTMPAPGHGPTLAMTLPYFDSVMRGRRLGTYNVDPDHDSLVRRYRLWEDIGDVRVLSLPARLAIDQGWTMPDRPQMPLRFNDAVMQYRTVPFSDLFIDLLKQRRTRPADEFRGKIVVIGASASGLFDRKATPVSPTHPGIDLLATAIDDTKNARFVDELGPAADVGISLALLCAMTWLCIRYSHEQLRLAFVIAPGLLFVVSYLTLNLSRVFVDLAQPASIAFVYFTLVKLYSAQVRQRWTEGELFAPLLEPAIDHWVACTAIALHPAKPIPGFETRYLNALRNVAPHVRITSGLDAQRWLGHAFSGVLVATWVEHADDGDAIARDRAEAASLASALCAMASTTSPVSMAIRETTIVADHASRDRDSPVPPRLARLRALVSSTVLAMTEGRGTRR